MRLEVDDILVQRMLRQVEDALDVTPADLDEVADYLVFRIQSRTRQGLDHEGNRFAPYAASTKTDRGDRGRETSRVTLEDSGRMMASMRGRGEQGAAVVYFASRTEGRKAAHLDEGTKHMKARRFMEPSDGDIEGALVILLRRMTDRISG